MSCLDHDRERLRRPETIAQTSWKSPGFLGTVAESLKALCWEGASCLFHAGRQKPIF